MTQGDLKNLQPGMMLYNHTTGQTWMVSEIVAGKVLVTRTIVVQEPSDWIIEKQNINVFPQELTKGEAKFFHRKTRQG